jgi:predicted deacylase
MPFLLDRLPSKRAAITLVTLLLSGWTASAGVLGSSIWLPQEGPTVLRPHETPDPTEAVEPTATPSLATPTATPEGVPMVIGTSVAGLPLEVFRFGTGPRELLIVAGIHGGYEWNTILLADALIANLRDGSVVVPQGVTLYLLRALNPDGYARSHGYEGRANENGVDLNRNWPLNWHPDWNRAGCWNYLPIGAGAHPLSEPETAALLAFILDHDFHALISYHSAALGIFPGGQPATEDSLRLAEAIAAVTEYSYPPREYGCEYTGQFADWAAAQGIAAVDVELSTHDSIDLWVNLSVLETFLSFEPQPLP